LQPNFEADNRQILSPGVAEIAERLGGYVTQ
jgi:hypothetical protein